MVMSICSRQRLASGLYRQRWLPQARLPLQYTRCFNSTKTTGDKKESDEGEALFDRLSGDTLSGRIRLLTHVLSVGTLSNFVHDKNAI